MSKINSKICVLLPFYNEEKDIVNVAKSILDEGYYIIFINDGSTDNSLANVLVGFDKEFRFSEKLDVISYKQNEGKGYALKRGAREAIKQGYDYVLTMDADGQTKTEDIKQFETALKRYPEAKIIIGNRLHSNANMPLLKRFLNKFSTLIISFLSKQPVADSQSGFRLIHKDVFGLNLPSNRYEFESEMLIVAGRAGMEIKNVPVKCVYQQGRGFGKWNIIRDVSKFIKLFFKYLFSSSPIVN